MLVERLRHSAGVGFGPLDLLVAILRLGPVDPARAAELDGLAPVLPDPTAGPTRVRDATTYVRDAVAAGRLLPPPITRDRMEEEGWVPDTAPDPSHRYARTHEGEPPDAFWEAMLPVPLGDFGASVRELGSDSYLAGHDQVVLRSVVPWQADLRLRATGLWHPYSDWWNGTQHLDSRGAIGVPCHDLLLAGYAADRPDSRREMVDLTLAWIGAGRYAVDPGLAASWARLKLGRLNLARCAAAWEQVFLAGGMRAAWPVALGTAAFAADLPRKPAGLADLLRMLTQYVGEVPAAGRDLPAPLVRPSPGEGQHQEPRGGPAAGRGGSVGVGVIEDLEAAFRAEDVDGVRRELAALDASGLAGARRWATKLKLDRWPGERRELVYAVLVIRLLTPQQVIDRLRRRGWPREGAADLIDEVLARDPEWRAGLVRVAGSLGVPADGVGLTGWALYQVVRAVSREDGLDVTWGELWSGAGWTTASSTPLTSGYAGSPGLRPPSECAPRGTSPRSPWPSRTVGCPSSSGSRRRS